MQHSNKLDSIGLLDSTIQDKHDKDEPVDKYYGAYLASLTIY